MIQPLHNSDDTLLLVSSVCLHAGGGGGGSKRRPFLMWHGILSTAPFQESTERRLFVHIFSMVCKICYTCNQMSERRQYG